MIAACAVSYFICGFIGVAGVPGLCLKLACSLMLSLAVLWAFSFKSDLFSQSMDFMKGTLRLLSSKTV